MGIEEGKDFTLELEDTLDMKENSFHDRLLHRLKYTWKKCGKKF